MTAELRLDPQGDIKRSPKLAKTQWAIREGTIPHTSSRSYVRFAVGEGRERRTDRNRKGELEGGVGEFYFKQLVQEIFMSKCTNKYLAAGLCPDPAEEPKRSSRSYIYSHSGRL